MHGHQPFRHYPPPMQDQGPQVPQGPPTPGVSNIDHIEARLRQLEHEEAARMAARSHLLAIRKREDEEFRRMTENAEVEEEVWKNEHDPIIYRILTRVLFDRNCEGNGNG